MPLFNTVPQCWICTRRAPRAPSVEWRIAHAVCDGKLTPFYTCCDCCYQMASALLTGMAMLLRWQQGASE